MIALAIDAMGGDFAPRAVIEGVAEALDSNPLLDRLFLVGDESRIVAELERTGKAGDARLQIVHTDQFVDMHEPAATAVRGKRRSSIALAVDLVKKGEAQGVVSAGHTGAAVASTVLKLRTMPGIDRPAIATVFPAPSGKFVVLDAGANVDCTTTNLLQFAAMGEIYAHDILGIPSPRVGLLNIGHEPGKGNELVKNTFNELSKLDGMNFVGNIEGHDLFDNAVDVVVCDGFVGNVLLKCSESVAKAFGHFLKQNLQKSLTRKIGALFSRKAYAELRATSDYAEYGGAPLLGVNGVCIIGHGSSSPKAIKNAIRVAAEAVTENLNAHILKRLEELGVEDDAEDQE
jgi:glycerol-3-phosphate acyltransferase PlsX